MGGPEEFEAITLGPGRCVLMGKDAMAGLLEDESPDDANGFAVLTVGRAVRHAVAVEGRCLLPGQHTRRLPRGQEFGGLAVLASGKLYADDVVRASSQQLEALVFGDHVIWRAHDAVERAHDGRVRAEAGEGQELGHNSSLPSVAAGGNYREGSWWQLQASAGG
jgi:hypothetical protein